MKRSYQTMIFATLCLAAMVSPVAVQAQIDPQLSQLSELIQPAPEEVFVPDETWPEVSSTIENWSSDDPLGCK